MAVPTPASQPTQPPTPRPAATSKPPKPPKPPDPQMEAINARWEVFKAADYEGQIALFTATLEEPELMDDEMAFEMLNTIHSAALDPDQRDRFDGLVITLRERLPEVYASSANYYLEWQITHACVQDRLDALPAWVRELTETAKFDIDIFNHVLDQLAYYGQLRLIVDAMRWAWPLVKTPGNVVPWGIEDFGFEAVHYVLLNYGQQPVYPDPGDPTLIEQIDYYHDCEPEGVQRFLAHLTGQADRSWSMEDFAFQRRQNGHEDIDRFEDEDDEDDSPPPPADPARRNLFDLSVEFLGYLSREVGVPLSKGELARRQLFIYLLERFDGELEPRESLLEAALRPRKHRRPKPKRRQPAHVLCPDYDTFDRFLAQRLDFINPQWYKVAATAELVPAWLRFLEWHGLLDAERHHETRQELKALIPALRQLLERHREDPNLLHGLYVWEAS